MSRISPTSLARYTPSRLSGVMTPYQATTTSQPTSEHLTSAIQTPTTPSKLPNSRVKRRIKTTFYRTPRRILTDEEDNPKGVWDRTVQTFLVTLLYAVIGFLVDGLIYVAKAMFSTAPVAMFWLFLPLLTLLGLILGRLMGGRALDALLIPFQTRDNPTFDEASTSYGMMKAVGLGLIFAVIGWLVLMMIT